MSLHTLKPRLVILTEILLASGVLLCGALKILPFDSVSMLIVMGTASVWLRNEGLRGIGLELVQCAMKNASIGLAESLSVGNQDGVKHG